MFARRSGTVAVGSPCIGSSSTVPESSGTTRRVDAAYRYEHEIRDKHSLNEPGSVRLFQKFFGMQAKTDHVKILVHLLNPYNPGPGSLVTDADIENVSFLVGEGFTELGREASLGFISDEAYLSWQRTGRIPQDFDVGKIGVGLVPGMPTTLRALLLLLIVGQVYPPSLTRSASERIMHRIDRFSSPESIPQYKLQSSFDLLPGRNGRFAQAADHKTFTTERTFS